MKCQDRGDWHQGIGEDVCKLAGGTWTRSPCITLQECIADRPTNTSADYSASFESFASQIVIENASDEDQCRHARQVISSFNYRFDVLRCLTLPPSFQRLGFDQNYGFDAEVCEEFKDRLCDPFYHNLDKATKHPGPSWNDIHYIPIHYPADPALNFYALPDKPTLKAIADSESFLDIAHTDMRKSTILLLLLYA